MTPTLVLPSPSLSTQPLIYRDSREKAGKGWFFPEDWHIGGTSIKHLPTGDYVLQGYESRLVVDRKAVCTELAQNLVSDRFERELARMHAFDRRLIVSEFPERQITQDWPLSSRLPPGKLKLIRTTAKFLKRRMRELTEEYGVEFLFFDNAESAKDYVYGLFINLMSDESLLS